MAVVSRRASEWVYGGVWALLSGLFRVPREAPRLPSQSGEEPRAFRPCEGWLRYRKIVFWALCAVIDVALFVVWAAVFAERPAVGLWLALPWAVVMIVPDVLAYVAIHLGYDTTWYIVSDRSMRLRRGIWVIHETTITFENVQNVKVTQGPIQRALGFSDVVVETAGGGGGGPHGHGAAGAHVGVLQGIEDAAAMREMILERVRASRGAGVGDERAEGRGAGDVRFAWGKAHLAALRDIAAHAAALRG